MSDTERNQYEEAAKYLFPMNMVGGGITPLIRLFQQNAFRNGCEYAHSKIEEAEREAHNRAIEMVERMALQIYENRPRKWLIEELKKLRK